MACLYLLLSTLGIWERCHLLKPRFQSSDLTKLSGTLHCTKQLTILHPTIVDIQSELPVYKGASPILTALRIACRTIRELQWLLRAIDTRSVISMALAIRWYEESETLYTPNWMPHFHSLQSLAMGIPIHAPQVRCYFSERMSTPAIHAPY